MIRTLSVLLALSASTQLLAQKCPLDAVSHQSSSWSSPRSIAGARRYEIWFSNEGPHEYGAILNAAEKMKSWVDGHGETGKLRYKIMRKDGVDRLVVETPEPTLGKLLDSQLEKLEITDTLLLHDPNSKARYRFWFAGNRTAGEIASAAKQMKSWADGHGYGRHFSISFSKNKDGSQALYVDASDPALDAVLKRFGESLDITDTVLTE